MQKLILLLTIIIFAACQKEEDNIYTQNELTYDLYQTSDYNYQGKAIIKEFLNGDLELTISLEGSKGEGEAYFFPAHLHYGSVNSPNAAMASMLNPIDIRTLKSSTTLDQLSNGTKLGFEDFKNFDGHIKVHLADSGPEYAVILVAGNVGKNSSKAEGLLDKTMIICSPYFE